MNRNDASKPDYDAKAYRTPDGAPSDIVIFTIAAKNRGDAKKALPERELQLLLIRRKGWPYAGSWALPGGFTRETETVAACAERELREETGISGVFIEYVGVYSDPGRDPRGWMISHAFCALVREQLLAERRAATDAAEVRLFPVDEALAMELAFDHRSIVQDALAHIRERMTTTTIAGEFLAEEFTLSELYQVIRTVVPEFRESNFIRKITSTQSRKGIIDIAKDEGGRPKLSNRYSQRAAQLYRFTDYVPKLSIYG